MPFWACLLGCFGCCSRLRCCSRDIFFGKKEGERFISLFCFIFLFSETGSASLALPPNGAGGAGQSLLRLLNKEPVSSTVDFRNSRPRDILLGLAGTQNPDSEAVTAVTDLLFGYPIIFWTTGEV